MLRNQNMVDLRLTRPPESIRPSEIASLEYAIEQSERIVPPPPKKERDKRADPEFRKREKMQKLSLTDQNPKTTSGEEKGLFADMTEDAQKRLRSMLINFCRKEDGSMLSEIDLRQYGVDCGQVVTNATVQELCTILPQLLGLNLADCIEVSDVGCWAIARHCPDIKGLLHWYRSRILEFLY